MSAMPSRRVRRPRRQALWQSALRSFEAKKVVSVPALDEVIKEIVESEKKTGRTRLTDLVEATPRMLKAASEESWAKMDGSDYTFIQIEIIDQLGAVAAKAHRIEALFSPTFNPPSRRWLCPGAPVAFDTEVAISHQPDPDVAWQYNYRAMFDEKTHLSAIVTVADEGVKLDGSQFDELMKSDALSAKGVVVGAPDRAAFRGTPSSRYLIKGEAAGFAYMAAREWLIPERRLDVDVAISTSAASDDVTAWLDRMERALVLI
jgi:hypothetical protein